PETPDAGGRRDRGDRPCRPRRPGGTQPSLAVAKAEASAADHAVRILVQVDVTEKRARPLRAQGCRRQSSDAAGARNGDGPGWIVWIRERGEREVSGMAE